MNIDPIKHVAHQFFRKFWAQYLSYPKLPVWPVPIPNESVIGLGLNTIADSTDLCKRSDFTTNFFRNFDQSLVNESIHCTKVIKSDIGREIHGQTLGQT